MKKTNLFGIVAILSALLLVFALFRRKLKWGFLFLNVLIALGEKWQENRDLNRIHAITDPVD